MRQPLASSDPISSYLAELEHGKVVSHLIATVSCSQLSEPYSLHFVIKLHNVS